MRRRGQAALFTLVAILVVAPFATIIAAIFANDILFLHDGREPIADNSVIVVTAAGTPEESWDVCQGGRFFLRQGPLWSSGPYRFIRIGGPGAMTFETWMGSPEGRAATGSRQEYMRHLQARAADAMRTIEIVIPSLEQAPPLDREPAPPRRPGMTGGRLGFDRVFRVDLEDGSVIQVPSR